MHPFPLPLIDLGAQLVQLVGAQPSQRLAAARPSGPCTRQVRGGQSAPGVERFPISSLGNRGSVLSGPLYRC